MTVYSSVLTLTTFRDH